MIFPDSNILSWYPLIPDQSHALLQCLQSWHGTPYLTGHKIRGMGVDCLNLITGILEGLFEKPQTPAQRLSGLSEPGRGNFAVLRAVRGFPSHVSRDRTVEPGDVVVTRGVLSGMSSKHPGHALVAGVTPWTFLHAVPDMGVCWTSIEAIPKILRVYRVRHKHLWRVK